MGNIPSRLCSIGPDPVSPPPLSSFDQRPFVLSTEPPQLRNIPSTSSFGLSPATAPSTAASRALRSRASSATLARSSSHGQRSRLLPLGRSQSVSEKRLSPNSEQLLADEFGIAPGATKVVSLKTPNLGKGSVSSSSGSGPGSAGDPVVGPDGRWVLEDKIPSPDLHLGVSDTGSVGKTGTGRRWSLKSLTKADRKPKGADSLPMLEFGATRRPSIPTRTSSLQVTSEASAVKNADDDALALTPERKVIDNVLLLRHQLRHTLQQWVNGSPDVRASDVQDGWQALSTVLQQALVDSPQAAKHLVRVSDAIDRLVALLPGSGEHAHLSAEVTDGLREVLEILTEVLDASAMGRPASHQTFGKKLTDTLRRVRRGSGVSTKSVAHPDADYVARATLDSQPSLHGLAFDESIFARPRPAFLDDEPLAATPDLTSSTSPTASASERPSPVGPFTPLDSPTSLISPLPYPVRQTTKSLALPIGFIAYNDAPHLHINSSRPTGHARSASLKEVPRVPIPRRGSAKARPSTANSSAAATFGGSPALSVAGTFGQPEGRDGREEVEWEKRWEGSGRVEMPKVGGAGRG